MKTRLTADHRVILNKLVDEKVTDPEARASLEEARGRFAAYLHGSLIEAWPQADMLVLEKYGKALTTRDFRVFDHRTDDFARRNPTWAFTLPRSVTVQTARLYLTRGEGLRSDTILGGFDLFDAVVAASHALDDAERELREPYRVLIRASATFEAVAEVWPEAAEVRPKIVRPQLPSVVTPDLRALIAADMQKRGVA